MVRLVGLPVKQSVVDATGQPIIVLYNLILTDLSTTSSRSEPHLILLAELSGRKFRTKIPVIIVNPAAQRDNIIQARQADILAKQKCIKTVRVM